jgi:4-hydroxy-4-methyl-2-oxoglutarate aldolase
MATPATLDTLVSALVGSVVTVPWRLLGRFEPAYVAARCAGPAVTVASPGGDNRPLYAGLAACRPGDVLVVALDGSAAAGHWGGLLTRAALRAGLAGVVVDGAVRDAAELATLGLPVFHRGLCPRKAVKRARANVGATVHVGGVPVSGGDVVVADADGVVVLAAADLPAMLTAAGAVLAAEAAIEERLAAGVPLARAFALQADP